MKNLFIFFVVLLVFFGCAVLGFYLAPGLGSPQAEVEPDAALSVSGDGDQHYLMLLQVDSLAAADPELVSAWFLSFYVTDVHPPTLTFTQIYPSQSNPERDRSIQSAFKLNSSRDPVDSFWESLRPFQIVREGYILIDSAGMEGVFSWLNDTPELEPASREMLESSRDMQQRMQAGCQATVLLSEQADRRFNWGVLFPEHIHTNIRMEMALAYWDRAMHSASPLRCEVFQAP